MAEDLHLLFMIVVLGCSSYIVLGHEIGSQAVETR